MAINGLPPGLAKKAESGKLPANNPHVQAYKAQQEADALKKENEQLKAEQKTVTDVLSFINLALAAALKSKQPAPAGQTANTGTATTAAAPAPAKAA